MELNRKRQLLTHLETLRIENQNLNGEEERLKKESEDVKGRIENFQRITKLELKETEMNKREQSQQRAREREMIAIREIEEAKALQ